MKGHQKLADYIQRICTLTESEVSEFVDAFEEVKIKKKQFIVQPNFIAQYRHFILKGAFRAYAIGEAGTDHTISFGIEDWWITDYNSYVYQQPATMFVISLENSSILRIEFEKEQELKKRNHPFETIFRIMAERGLAFQQRRMISNLTLSAEKRYDEFLAKYPHIVRRLPQYALASYLGMTTEFLSKIRNHKNPKKKLNYIN